MWSLRAVYAAILVAVVAGVCYAGYRYYLLHNAYTISQQEYRVALDQMEALRTKLAYADALNTQLQSSLQLTQSEKDQMSQRVEAFVSNVATLDKLVHTDKELLAKYSSVYFLNENYHPRDLQQIDPRYLHNSAKSEQVIATTMSHLTKLLDAAAADNIPLQVVSAYRSYDTQSTLKNAYKVTYGAGTANSFSADQGYSEHQLGTTIDFTGSTTTGALAGFDKTKAYAWLNENAYLYGFNLSYPKGNTHFIFEPWHWRYVGIELATKLHDEHKALYDLDQREINTYLAKFGD